MKSSLLILLSFLCIQLTAQSGVTWSAPLEVSSGSEDNMHPRVAVDGSGNPIVIWGRMADESVYLSRLSGGAFTTPLKVNPAGMTVAAQTWMGPDLASKGDTVYVAVKRSPEVIDTNHIYLIRSTDGGMTFGAPVRVDNIADSISRFPTVTTDDLGNPLVGFMKFDASFAEARWVVSKSTDYGSTFSTDVLASGWSGGTVCDCCPGAIVCSGSNVAMMYRDANANIRDSWAGISSDGGTTFPQGIAIDQGGWMLMMCPSSGPDGVMIGDTLYSVFMNGNSGTNRVYYSKSPLSVPASSTAIPLTGSIAGLTGQNFPRIASSGNAAAIAWRNAVSGTQQLAVSFTADITSGLPASYDTVALDATENTDIAMINGKIFVVWQDDNAGKVMFREGSYAPLTNVSGQMASGMFSFSPNPASDQLFIETKSGFSGDITVEIRDLTGRKITQEILPFCSGRAMLPVASLQNGICFVTLRYGSESITYKLIVNH